MIFKNQFPDDGVRRVGTAIHPTIGLHVLKHINCVRRDSFGCTSIPSSNYCHGKERKFQSVRVRTWTMILFKNVILYSWSLYRSRACTRLDCCVVCREACYLRSWSSSHPNSSNIEPTLLWVFFSCFYFFLLVTETINF